MINESSTTRILKHLTDDKCLAIISPYRTENNEKENLMKMKELKTIAKKYGFTEFISRWSEQSENGDVLNSDERSLMIFNIPLNDAMKIGEIYNQSSIIYKNGDKCCEICTSPFTSFDGREYKPDDIVRVFSQKGNMLNLDKAKEIFSGLKSGAASFPVKGNRAFTLTELLEIEQPRPSYFQTNENLK